MKLANNILLEIPHKNLVQQDKFAILARDHRQQNPKELVQEIAMQLATIPITMLANMDR